MHYSYQPPAGLPPHLQPADDSHEEFFSVASEQAMNQQQVQALLDWYYQRASSIDGETADSDKNDQAAREAAVREALGQDSGSVIELGRHAAASLFGEVADDVLSIELGDGALLGDHPLFIQALARAGQQMSARPDEATPADPEKIKALKRIQALRKLQDTDRLSYESPETQASLRAAYAQAYPGN